MSVQYKLVESSEGAAITVFADGEMYPATNDHPNWFSIVEGAKAGDPKVVDLFDLSATVAKHFRRLTDRVTVANGLLYLDGDIVNNALSDAVVRFVNAGVDNWKPLVAFFEKVQTNPQDYSREQLYTFLMRREFTITNDGDIVGYKGVAVVADGYTSKSSGTATVNGVVHTGRIPQNIGDVVEMPRSEVAFDPSQGCSTGLHVANWDFAKNFGSGGAVLTVAVNPRDVVSVPTDSNFAKVRVCRYKVLGVTEMEIPDVVLESESDDEDFPGDDVDDVNYDYDECGTSCEDCGYHVHNEWDDECFTDDFDCGCDNFNDWKATWKSEPVADVPVRIPAGQPGAGQFARSTSDLGVESHALRFPKGHPKAGQFATQAELDALRPLNPWVTVQGSWTV